MKLIYGIILGMIIMYIITNNNGKKNNREKQIEFAAQKLVRQAARWSTAAKQDKNSMIAVLHANYGAGYLWALKLRTLRKTEPYKGKGVREKGQYVLKKEGKKK